MTLVIAAGDHQHLGPGRPEPGHEVEPVGIVEEEVEQHQLRPELCRLLQNRAPRVKTGDGAAVAPGAQGEFESLRQHLVVLHDQDGGRLGAAVGGSPWLRLRRDVCSAQGADSPAAPPSAA